MHPIEYKLKTITDDLKEKGYGNLLIRNILKEYLQDLILYIMYSDRKYKDLTFYGGTCLRKLYGFNRLSEDLDFETLEPVDLNNLKEMLLNYFKIEKLRNVSASVQKSEKVNRCILKFEILNMLELSDSVNEKLHIKIEINENMDKKYSVEYTPYSKDIYSMVIKHYPLPVLMASKMLACIFRVYKKGNTGISVKGRDFYDLIWYMQNNIVPDEDVFACNNITSKEAFKRIDDIVRDINVRDLLIDLEALFDDTFFITNWCNKFHGFYDRYRKNYLD